MPCIIKRLGIRLNNAELSNGGSALFFPAAFALKMSWYRDFYHYKYLNGKFTNIEEDLMPEPMNFDKFLMTLDPKLATEIKNRPMVRSYPVKHPRENVKFGVYREKYAHLTESHTRSDSHEGGDFVQENALGRVIPYLKRGEIFSVENFAEAVRRCQTRQDKTEQSKKELPRNRPKYENEIAAVAALILHKNEDPHVAEGLGDLHEDVMRIKQIGLENYKTFFKNRIYAVPTGSIKLKPAFITRKAQLEFQKIENQTKKEISEKIKELILKINFEDPQEKIYYENKSVKTELKKSELIDIFTELSEMLYIEDISVD